MNKVITINLGGLAYQLEEDGYDLLRAYLETATARLDANPDREEILSDIERAIGEKFRALLASHKTVVIAREVSAVLAEMGPIDAEPEAAAGARPDPGAAGPKEKARPAELNAPPRRLYRIQEGAMIAGVCNGLAAYFNLDPTLVRLAFVFLTIFWGAGLMVYIVMAIVVPEAQSPEEKTAASGFPSTAQQFIRRAKEGYYEAMKNFPDRKAHREWARQFKRNMRSYGDYWRYRWPGCWSPPVASPGLALALPFLSLLHAIVVLIWICALISLLATGMVCGLDLPANLPVWMAVLLLLIVYGILAAPLKVARQWCYHGMDRCRAPSVFAFLLDVLIWLVVAVALLWMAVHFSPELHQAFQGLPSVLHQATDDIRNWWQGK
jgi:phage shock protein PspC (stress-responsive transcriptional regulator)